MVDNPFKIGDRVVWNCPDEAGGFSRGVVYPVTKVAGLYLYFDEPRPSGGWLHTRFIPGPSPAPETFGPRDYYDWHPSGVQCATITEGFNFNLGCVIKYAWRAGRKTPDAVGDLRKAADYLAREIIRIEAGTGVPRRDH